MRAAIYLRISQDATGEQAGVTRQHEDCLKLAESLDWEVAEVYTDNDISASGKVPRPAYRKMLADIELGVIEGIIAWSPDRLYRKLTDLETLIPTIENNNVAIRTCRLGTVELTTAYGRMIARILGAVTTGEGEIKSERWRRSWRQGRESGAPPKTGTRLFGYTRDSEVIPEEAELVREMVEEVLTGGSIQGIARRWEQMGLKTTRGTTWRPGTIRQYLANPRIAGYSTLKGEILGEGDWEPLVDRQTWESLRAFLEARHRPYVPRVSLLNGLVFCGRCQTRLITGQTRKKRLYRCPNRPGMGGCGNVSIYASTVDELVEAYAATALDQPEVRARVAELRAEPGGLQVELAELEMRIHELEQQLDEPGTPVATILRAIDRTKEKQETLLGQLAALPRTPVPERGGEWPTDLKRRRALVDLVVERIEVSPSAPGLASVDRVKITPR